QKPLLPTSGTTSRTANGTTTPTPSCSRTALSRRNTRGRCSPKPGEATANRPSRSAMLAALSIRDIVLIDKLDLEFGQGLSALTGETGAGKSILLDAFSLAIGGRGDAALVRRGASQGPVTASFALAPNPPAFPLPPPHPAHPLYT